MPDEDTTVVLRDLQTILRKTIDTQLTVVNYTTDRLLQTGENYASTMLKVEATIKKTKNSKEEKIFLVAKMIPTSEFQRKLFKPTISYEKEMFVFEKLVPAYRQIERELGVMDEDLIDILPRYYGGRLTMNDEKPNEADEDAVMLMENLKVRGYYMSNRTQGMDLEHAKVAMSKLAQFHALGMALKHKKPEMFEESKRLLNVFPFDMSTNEFEGIVENTVDLICKDQRTAKYEDRIRQILVEEDIWERLTVTEMNEPWVTVIHGDFWVNNILFHKSNGKIDDIKIIDYQISKVTHPLMDIPYFACASCSMEILDNNFDELLDLYYETFVQNLIRNKCDASPFARKNFDTELSRIAKTELFHCLMALKFFTLDVKETDATNVKNVITSEPNKLYTERAWRIIKIFTEKGWI